MVRCGSVAGRCGYVASSASAKGIRREGFGLGVLALLLAGCGQPQQLPREQDVVDALVDSVISRMGRVVVVSRPSDCRGARVAVPPAAWAAYRDANGDDADGLDLAAYAARLRVDTSKADAEAIRARHGMPVVALSRVGLAGDAALLCVEIFAAGDRGYYLLLDRAAGGSWSLKSELPAWEEAAESWELPPEELPDGELYRP